MRVVPLRVVPLFVVLGCVAFAPPAFAVDSDLRKLAASDDADERQSAAKQLAQEGTPASVKLLRKLIADDDAEVRDWGVQYCGYLKDEKAIAALVPLTKASADWVRRNGVAALGRTHAPAAAEPLRKVALTNDSPVARAEALVWLRYLKDHADVDATYVEAFADDDPTVRAMALVQQNTLRGASAVEMARTGCDDPDEGVRCAARWLLRRVATRERHARLREVREGDGWRSRVQRAEDATRMRTQTSLDVLVELVGDEHPRVAYEAHQGLLRLSGKRFGRDAELWAAWWKQNRDAWKRPDELPPVATAVTEGETFARYHGVEVASAGVLFALDVSSSMRKRPQGKSDGPTRWELASAELLSTLDALPDGQLVNVAFFGDAVDVAFPRPRPLSPNIRKHVRRLVRRTNFAHLTNLFAVLQTALAMDDIDTVFILSDGLPTAGEMVHKGRIRPAFWRANRRRKLAVHTISLASGDYGTELLSALATKNSGRFVKK